MVKLPPIIKVLEAYTAIVDKRVVINNGSAIVKSSDKKKEYTIIWKDDTYYSNDNSTYWQGYIGYPVIAVLMLSGKLSYDDNIAKQFSGLNWNSLNKEYHRDYDKLYDFIILKYDDKVKNEINKVYEEIKKININLTKKKTNL